MELEAGLRAYFWFYDEERPHQSLDYRTPGEVYRAGIAAGEEGRTLTNTAAGCPDLGSTIDSLNWEILISNISKQLTRIS